MAQEAGLDATALLEEQKHYERTYHGDVQNGAVHLGQSIGLIDSVDSVSDIIESIMKGAEAAIKRITNLII